MLKKNVDLGPPLRLSSWRKIALGTWRSAGDPSIYTFVDIDIEPSLKYLAAARARTGLKLTLTQYCGRVFAECIGRHPQINSIQRLGRLYPRKTVDIFFQVASDTTGEDLSGMTVRNANKKTLEQICREMEERVVAIRSKRDQSYAKMKKTMGGLPGWASGLVLKLAGFVLYTLNLWTPLIGSPRDSFGSMMLTSVGGMGLDVAFAPLVPFSRVPLIIAVGAVREAPVVRDGQLAIAKLMRLTITLDHRVIDGLAASHLSKTMHAIFANPEKELGPA